MEQPYSPCLKKTGPSSHRFLEVAVSAQTVDTLTHIDVAGPGYDVDGCACGCNGASGAGAVWI